MEIDFEPSPELFPYEPHWFDSSVGPVHYIDAGEGRPLLLLHGNPTWSFLYRGIVERLSSDFRCIAVDYPGFGLSTRPDDYGYTPSEHARVVGELVDALELEDWLVMGQDWGGPIGLSVASSRAERVSGMIFGNTWFWPTDRLLNKIFSRTMSAPPMRWAILQHNAFVEWFLPIGTEKKLGAEVMNHYRAVQPTPAVRRGTAEFPRQLVAAADWLASLRSDVDRQLSHLPVLLTWGMRDPAFSPGHFIPPWTEMFASCTVVELTGAKHFIQEDAPRSIADSIRRKFG